jgi:acetyl esterase/lipase
MRKFPIRKRTIIPLLVIFITACVSYNPDSETDSVSDLHFDTAVQIEDIEFTPAGWPEPLTADLTLPDKKGPLPVVLTIHGGGWSDRDRSDMNGIGAKLVEQGYAVLNMSYRFAPVHRYPAQLNDVQQAIGWIADHAKQYDLDVSRINTWGYSSGAHLAALVASYDDNRLESEYDQKLPTIRSVVAGGIPADLRQYSESPIISNFIGGFREQMPDEYADASPAFHIDSNDPPVFLYHGKLDFLVKPDQSINYYQSLRDAGIDAELYLHSLHTHITLFLLGADADEKAINFLNRKNLMVSTG